jgi:hypothetical protein
MGRPSAPRCNYARDAQSLQRIVIAVQSDETRSQEWRREQVNHLTSVIVAFNNDAVKDRPAESEVEQALAIIGTDKPRRKIAR